MCFLQHVVASIIFMYTAWSTVSKFVFFFARINSSVVTAGHEANGHVRPSSSRWFAQYGLDRVRWLALILGLCRCVDELESK